jgi:hypothetical protein
MLQTLIKIGKKLREDKDDVSFLPFVEIGNIENKFKGEKVVQEKPDVQIYNIFIKNDDEWEIKKDIIETNANHRPIFIKGDNNDRFYIAGDINGNYFGTNVTLKKYFHVQDKELEKNKNDIPSFVFNFRKTIEPELENIEKQIIEFNANPQNKKSGKRLFIQFTFHKGEKKLYWEDFALELEKVSEFIIKTNYIKKKGNKIYLKKIPVSFYSEYNLNNLQNLEQENSDRIIDINNSLEDVKSIIVAANYTSKKTSYFGKALIQVLPAGEYKRNILMYYLKTPVLKQKAEELKGFEELYLPGLDIFGKLNAGIRKFDVLFLNRGAQTVDVINYITSIELSDIEKIQANWKSAKNIVSEYYQKEIAKLIESNKVKLILENEIYSLNPFGASNNLLKGFGKNDGKLTKYHRQILYKIFRNQYFDDPLILNGFINKSEYGLRSNSKRSDFMLQFQILFLNYLYLDSILINSKFFIMQETKSYQAGKLLGSLARNLDQEINSFSKQYAGNISRRISTLQDFQKLLNFVQTKLVMHKSDEKYFGNIMRMATELNVLFADFNELYKKENAVAGFFYSYMMPFESKKKETELPQTNN